MIRSEQSDSQIDAATSTILPLILFRNTAALRRSEKSSKRPEAPWTHGGLLVPLLTR